MATQAPHADPAAGRDFREILRGLVRMSRIRGGVIVAPDGFVIAADLPPAIGVEPLAALAATLGRELEVGTAKLGRGAFRTAIFSADDGTLILGTSPVGFVLLLCERDVNAAAVRGGLKNALDLIHAAWGQPT